MTVSVTLSRPAGAPAGVIERKTTVSDGFNWPTFKLLNNRAQLTLSPNPASIDKGRIFCHFAISNLKGWFAAITNTGSASAIILSPLADLRVAILSSQPNFTALRTLTLPTYATHIAFAINDSRLFVGLDNGTVVAYDSAIVLCPGPSIDPVASNNLGVPLRAIVPNPGNEEGLVDLVAIPREDGIVVVVNAQIQVQAEFKFTERDFGISAVAWSPKGKQLAIGTRCGDIFTHPMPDPSKHQRRIPSTAQGVLSTLNWLGPGFTFRTTYSPLRNASGEQTGDPILHILQFDHRTSNTTVFEAMHPYPNVDRPLQNSYAAILPKFDEDAGNELIHNYLVVLGDTSSVDLEILASDGNQWYQQSQENQLSLPLDKDSNDTIPLFIGTDLTDPAGSPILYIYANNGTIQSWYINHTKPYVGMVNTPATVQPAKSMETETPTKQKNTFGTTASGPSAPGFSQAPTKSAFGQAPAFGQSAFQSSPSSFADQETPKSAFGGGPSSSFGGSSASAFGQPHNPTATSAFGQTAPATQVSTDNSSAEIVDMSMEASTSGGGFGGMSLGGNGDSSKSAFGGGIFGQGAVQHTSPPTTNTNSVIQPGSGAFGSPSSGFGGASTASSFIKPAQGGFGTRSSFGQAGGESAAVASAPRASGFGQTGFGSASTSASTMTKPTQGSAFGQTGFGSAPSGGGFGAFASKGPSAFGGDSKPADTPIAPSSGGFSAFSSGGTSAFGAPTTPQNGGTSAFKSGGTAMSNDEKPAPSSGGGFSAFGPPSSAFGSAESKPATSSGGGFSAFSGDGSKPATSSGGGFSAFSGDGSKPATSTGGGFSAFSGDGSKPATSSGGGFSAFSGDGSKPATSSGGGFSAFSGDGSNKQTTLSEGFGGGGAAFINVMNKGSKPSPSSAFSGTSASGIKPSTDAQESKTSVATKSDPQGSGSGSAFSAFGNGSTLQAPTTPEGKSYFGQDSPKATNTVSAFSPGPQPTTSAFGQRLEPKTPTSQDDSPPSTPRKSLAIPDSPPSSPEASPSKRFPMSSIPTESAAAQTSAPSFLKPARFGAFGSKDSGTSAFLKPTGQLKVSSAFSGGSLAPATSSITPTDKPVFGATTAFGTRNKPTTTTPKSSPSTPSVRPTTGGFSAFSSKGPAVGSGPKQSFSDLLKDDAKAEGGGNIPPISIKKEPKEATLSDKGGPSTPIKSEPQEESDLVLTPKKIPPPRTPPVEEEEQEPISPSGPPVDDGKGASDLKKDLSASSASFTSQASSFVNVSAEDANEDGSGSDGLDSGSDFEPEEEEGDEDEDVDAHGDVDDFLSDGLSEIEEVTEEEEEEEEEEDHDVLGAASTPLPLSRSATPQRDMGSTSVKSPSREQSTTPPGSPAKGTSPVVQTPVKAASSSPPSLFPPTPTLVANRSSTRPLKSSPLAGGSTFVEQETPSGSTFVEQETPKKAGTSAQTLGNIPPKKEIPSTSAQPAKTSSFPMPITPLSDDQSPGSLFNLGNNVLTSGIFASGTTSVPATPTTPSSIVKGVGSAAHVVAGSQPSLGAAVLGAGPSVPKSVAPSTPGLFGSMPVTPTPSVLGNQPGPVPRSAFGSPSPTSFFAEHHPSTPSPLFPPKPAPSTPPQGSVTTGPSISPSTLQTPQQIPVEQGMQRECARLVVEMDKELLQLRDYASKTSKALDEYKRPLGGSKNAAELWDVSKWGVTDARTFITTMRHLEKDLETLQSQRVLWNEDMRKMKGLMVKAGTRKEEIARFNKARSDVEVARMIKSRTLGSDYAESQTQLRRDLRNIQTRVDNLESSLISSKKKLSEHQTGKKGMKPPTLDTINRTYRNIDRTIYQQEEDLDRLKRRVSKMDPAMLNTRHSRRSKMSFYEQRDPRLPDPASTILDPDTPQNAAAAAMNTEVVAQKVKQKLLDFHKEPLLNRVALTAAKPPQVFNTPQKAAAAPTPLTFNPPLGASLFASVPPSATTLDEFSLPSGDDTFSPTPLQPQGRRGAGVSGRMHAQGIRLPPKTASPSSSSPTPPNFQWGPLPAFTTPTKPKDSQFISFTKQ